MNGLEVRQIRAGDLDAICAHREAMFRDSGRTEEVLRAMAAPFRSWLAPRLASGDYFGHVLADHGRTIAGIGLMLIDWPPHPAHPDQGYRGYVLNVYVEPESPPRYRPEADGPGRRRLHRTWRHLRSPACHRAGGATVRRPWLGWNQRDGAACTATIRHHEVDPRARIGAVLPRFR
jgi:hypothetical protein